MKLLQEIRIEVSDEGHLFVNGVDTHQAKFGGSEEMKIAERNGYIIEVARSGTDVFRAMSFIPTSWESDLSYRTALIPQPPKKVPMTREDIEAMIVEKRTWVRLINTPPLKNGEYIWYEIINSYSMDKVIHDLAAHEYSHDLKNWHKFEKEVQP